MSSRNNGSLISIRGVGSRQITPTLPPAPAGLSQQQLKRRHIVAAIVHSENSYVATLQRLVNVRIIFLFFIIFICSFNILFYFVFIYHLLCMYVQKKEQILLIYNFIAVRET